MDTKALEILISGLVGGLVAIPLTLLLTDPISQLLARWTGGIVSSGSQRVDGTWHSTYTRTDKPADQPITETINITRIGNQVMGKVANDRKLRFKGQIKFDQYITGLWFDPRNNGRYHGGFQFVLSFDGNELSGRWVGFSQSSPKVLRHGEWVMKKN